MSARAQFDELKALVHRRNRTATDALRAAAAARQAERDLSDYLTAVEKTIPEAAARETRPVKEPTTFWRRGRRVRFVGDQPAGIHVRE